MRSQGSEPHQLRAGRRRPGAGAAARPGGAKGSGWRRRSRRGPWCSVRGVEAAVPGVRELAGELAERAVAPRDRRTPFIHDRGGKLAYPWAREIPRPADLSRVRKERPRLPPGLRRRGGGAMRREALPGPPCRASGVTRLTLGYSPSAQISKGEMSELPYAEPTACDGGTMGAQYPQYSVRGRSDPLDRVESSPYL